MAIAFSWPWGKQSAERPPPEDSYEWESRSGISEAPSVAAAEPEDFDDESDAKEAACADFIDLLGHLYLTSKISAEVYCNLCFSAPKVEW